MNQSQRKYLLEEIEKERSNKVNELEEKRTDRPAIGKYLLQAVLSGAIQLKSQEEILESIKTLALRGEESKDGEPTWEVIEVKESSRFTRGRWRTNRSSKPIIQLPVGALFVIPDEYKKLLKDWKMREAQIDAAIDEIDQAAKGLCTRIQLASPSVLAKLIAEVDDMGDLSFMDESLKLISRSEAGLPPLLNRGQDTDED